MYLTNPSDVEAMCPPVAPPTVQIPKAQTPTGNDVMLSCGTKNNPYNITI
jgi:hypothetical protein